jgi:putative acetyltransferase
MNITINPERPDTPVSMQLIIELNAALNPDQTPAESIHGYSVEKLIRLGVAFFVVRVEGEPAGCCGVQVFDEGYAELKRMFLRPPYRGQGLNRVMIDHLAAHASEHGVALLRLETGILQHDAIRSYTRYGFVRCGPFGDYREDPHSVYMEMRLA